MNKTKQRQAKEVSHLDPVMQEYVLRKDSVTEIANRHGLSAGALTSRAKKLGIPLRGQGRWTHVDPDDRDLQIIELAKTLSYREVGKRFGLSRQRVYQIIVRWRGSKNPKAAVVQHKQPIQAGRAKSHVISFRVDSINFCTLAVLHRSRWFSHLRSASDVAREIVDIYLKNTLGKQ